MESVSTTTPSHPLPHQQFSSRIAFANKTNSVTKLRLNKTQQNSLSNKKSTRLPPIARYDGVCSPPTSSEGIRYFNRSADSSKSCDEIEANNLDPNLRVKQLERNIKFVREDCQQLLESLHRELEDLKVKNRGIYSKIKIQCLELEFMTDLTFQLITNGSFTPQFTKSLTEEQLVLMPLIRGALEPQIGEYIIRLENEVKRLRIALGDTLRNNHLLKEELQKRKDGKQSADASHKSLSSPTIREFNKTFEEINKICESNPTENTFNLPRIANNISKNN